MYAQSQSRFQLSQDKELAPRSELAGVYELIYAFSRSAERQKREYPGADYLSFSYNGSQLFFSICDGVSGGFAGYVAAKFIGDQLVEWSKYQNVAFENVTALEKRLSEVLQDWIKDGTELVNSTPLLLNGDETDRDFMERRRKKGSQTMFLLGVLDVEKNQAFITGLGDIRMLVKYNNKSEPDFVIGQTKNRWSTLEGQIGNLWSKSYKLSEINCFTMYTDGFEQFSSNPISVQAKSELGSIALPKDDVTVFSVKPSRENKNRRQSQPPKYQIKDDYIIFDKVNNDEWIRVFVEDDVLEVANSKIFLNEDFKSAGRGQIRYQVVGEKTQPSGTIRLKIDGQPEEVELPTNILGRRKPVISPPIMPRPVNPAYPRAPTPIIKKDQNIGWWKYFGVLGLAFALISWIITAYFFLQTGRQKEEIRGLSQQVETQQAILLEYKAIPTVVPTLTIIPAFTETATPVNALSECITQEDGLQVFKTPDMASLPIYIMPAGHNFFVLQVSEDQNAQEWIRINDPEISFNGWLKSQSFDQTKICIASQ